MSTRSRQFLGVVAVSAALLAAGASPALAAAPAPAASAAQPALAGWWDTIRADPRTGYPDKACSPVNDGEEISTFRTVLGPPLIVVIVHWRCFGQTGTWRKIGEDGPGII